MPSFDTSYERSGRAPACFGQLASRVNQSSELRILFFTLLICISPNACTSFRFSPCSVAELQRAVGNCIRQSPKCDYSIARWDVSNVRHMSGMFQGAKSFNRDISKWQVSSVISMKNMFRNAVSFNQNLCGALWANLKAVKTDMFVGSPGSISRDVCTSTAASQEACPSTTPEETTPPITYAGQKIRTTYRTKPELEAAVWAYLHRWPETMCGVTSNSDDCPEGDIGDWDVSSIRDMSNLFKGAVSFNGDISKWDVSGVEDMSGMFQGASAFNGDLSAWDVSSARTMSTMFKGAKSFNGDISKWDISKVTDMNAMFADATAFDGDISQWDVSKVTDMTDMFHNAEAFNDGDFDDGDPLSHLFENIVARKIPSHTVYEDDLVYAFLDINPLSNGHCLVIPKKRYTTLDQVPDETAAALGRALPRVARAVKKATGCKYYNILQNNGQIAHQEVPHVHFHIIPKYEDAQHGQGMGVAWPAEEKNKGFATADLAQKIMSFTK